MIAYAPEGRGLTVAATQEIGWIDDDASLARVVAALADTSIAAVDTEFVREKTYYPQLCLIQIGTGEQVACVDCLAGLDLAPLYARLFDPGFTWVLHSARQDLEVIFQLTGRMPPRLIDTQVAAALTGYPPQVGLEGLLKRTLEVELGESFARTDWSRRPLPEAALKYALDDVRYLLAAWAALDAELGRLGRREWLREDCERLLAEQPVADTTAVWSRLKGVHGAAVRVAVRGTRDGTLARNGSAAQRSAAAVAARRRRAARDRGARCRATPMRSRRSSTRNSSRAALRPLSRPSHRATTPELETEVRANAMQAVPDKTLVKSLQERVRQHAAVLGIEPEILATKRDLAGVALGNPPPHLRTGWRAQRARARYCKRTDARGPP